MRDNKWLDLPPSYTQQILQPLAAGNGTCCFLADDAAGRSLYRVEFEHPEHLLHAAKHEDAGIRARYAIMCQREGRKLAKDNGCTAVVS